MSATATVQKATIPDFLPENWANRRGSHWAQRYRAAREEKALAWYAARAARWQRVEGRARLTITLVFPSARSLMDEDNLHHRVKHILDGLKGETGWVVDDSPKWLELVVEQRAEKGRRAVEMTLEETE